MAEPHNRTAVLVLRLLGAVLASAAFGLIAALTLPQWSFPAAVALGFLFGTSFIAGTGYRIILGTARGSTDPAPASWSGATVGAALFGLVAWAVAEALGANGLPVLLGLGVAINIAYFCAKAACFQADCCHATRNMGADLRVIEITATGLILAVTALLALAVSLPLAAVVALLGHLAVRLGSRWWRGRGSWGWPPLRQPGAELAPLMVLVVVAAAVPLFG